MSAYFTALHAQSEHVQSQTVSRDQDPPTDPWGCDVDLRHALLAEPADDAMTSGRNIVVLCEQLSEDTDQNRNTIAIARLTHGFEALAHLRALADGYVDMHHKDGCLTPRVEAGRFGIKQQAMAILEPILVPKAFAALQMSF